MSDFLKQWLEQNKIDNEKTLKVLKETSNSTGSGEPQQQQQQKKNPAIDPIPSTSGEQQQQQQAIDPIPSTSSGRNRQSTPLPSTSQQAQQPDVLVTENEARAQNATKPSDLVFENDSLKLLVSRGTHRQQTKSKFRLTDHMFYLSIVPKTKTKKMPLLVEILNFLYVAFNFILNQLKKFYNPADRNIAFITVTQNSMINGLNSGISHF